MEKYRIKGMSCASCSTRIEKKVSSLKGVDRCNVNLLTNSMEVEGNIDSKIVIEEVIKLGYGASIDCQNEKTEDLKGKVSVGLKFRLISSIILLLILMYFSMGYMMLNFPLPKFLEENLVYVGLIQFFLALAIIVINNKFFINGGKGLIHFSPNMDSLVAIGSFFSFAYSVVILILMFLSNDHNDAHDLMMNLYFESSAMVLTLVTLGKLLEDKAKGKTTNALKALMKLSVKKASILRNGSIEEENVEDVKVGEIFLVKPGEIIPFDGEITKGSSSIDESSLTGESMPVDKEVGNQIFEGTINLHGYLEGKVLKEKKDSTLSQIIKIVNEASSSKAPISKIADKVAGVFVPIVILIAIVTFIIWMIIGQDVGFSLNRAISVLVVSCPCSLGLATPVAIMVGSGMGAKNGILFKNATALEITGKIKQIALDKTGTVTKGEPQICDIIPYKDISKEQLLEYAFSIEQYSEHPLAKAIVKYGKENHISSFDCDDFKAFLGSGIISRYKGHTLVGGNKKLLENHIEWSDEIEKISIELSAQGKTPLFFAKDNQFLGVISVSDVIKDDTIQSIDEMKKLGLNVSMITGDNRRTGENIANKIGINQVYSEVLPQDKRQIIESMQKESQVIMVGDGINDVLALTQADIGIAIGSGTDIAIDSSDVVIMKNNLKDVVNAIKLSRQVLKNIKENLFWAFSYNIVCIPLAAGLFYGFSNMLLDPMLASLMMSLSSIIVVSNSLRLNYYKVNRKEKVKMIDKTITIEGMMCEHCQNHVKKALESLPNALKVEVDYKTKLAKVRFKEYCDEKAIINVVKEAGYQVVDIK